MDTHEKREKTTTPTEAIRLLKILKAITEDDIQTHIDEDFSEAHALRQQAASPGTDLPTEFAEMRATGAKKMSDYLQSALASEWSHLNLEDLQTTIVHACYKNGLRLYEHKDIIFGGDNGAISLDMNKLRAIAEQFRPGPQKQS